MSQWNDKRWRTEFWQLKIEVLPPNNGSKKCLEKSLAVKAIIHDIHAKAVEKGEKNQPIN